MHTCHGEKGEDHEDHNNISRRHCCCPDSSMVYMYLIQLTTNIDLYLGFGVLSIVSKQVFKPLLLVIKKNSITN